MNLQELVSIVENLTDGTQMFLRDALKEILFKGNGTAKIKPCAELERILETGIIVQDSGMCVVSDWAKKSVRKLYTYLGRKFDTDICFDPNTGNMVEIPKGAIFETEFSLRSGDTHLSMHFPDDEITAMLDLFGTNPCCKRD